MTKYRKIAFLFPGQGAQYVGMARDFYENFSVAKETFQHADDILKQNLTDLIFQGPENLLTATKNSQLAIFVVSVALLRTFQQLFPALHPAVCAGLSLGEYTALHASGRVDFEPALKLVKTRGQLMNDACEANPGAMAVILGLAADQVQNMVKELKLPRDLWAANFNCPGQVVISGTSMGIERGMAAAKELGAKRAILLPVHGAFHSGLMRSAEEGLAEYVQSIALRNSPVDFVMNVPGEAVFSHETILSNLIKQVTHPVKWEQGVRYMEQAGVELFIEIGCKKTLSEFNKRMQFKSPIPTWNIEKVNDLNLIEREMVS